MHNKVVYHVMKTFSAFGLPVVRFNFRGAGLSDGRFDDGLGEQDDVRAALDWMTEMFARLPQPKRLVWVPGADHFFQGVPASPESKLGSMQTALREWLRDTFHLT